MRPDQPSPRLRRATLFCALIASVGIPQRGAAAQDGPAPVALSPAERAVVKRIGAELDAAKARQKKDPEAAALIIARARSIAAELDTVPQALQARIDAIARRIDNRDTTRRKATAKAARLLLRAGGSYLDAGWRTTAEPLLREAARLDPRAARAAIAKLDGAASTGAGGSLLTELLERGETIWGTEEWAFAGDGLRCPEYDKSKVLRIGAQRRDFAGDGWSVGMQCDREAERTVGLVFAYRHIEQWAMLRVRTGAANATLEIVTVEGGKETVLANQTIDFGATPPEHLKVRLESRRGEWSAGLDGHPPFATKRPEKGLTPRGFVGLYLKGTRSMQEPLTFQSLTMAGGR